jgi:hypothetical protein
MSAAIEETPAAGARRVARRPPLGAPPVERADPTRNPNIDGARAAGGSRVGVPLVR